MTSLNVFVVVENTARLQWWAKSVDGLMACSFDRQIFTLRVC